MIVASVWTGKKYEMVYVRKLYSMVTKHLPQVFRAVCLTDHDEVPLGVERVDISRHHLPQWWGKMALFDPVWRQDETVLYLDLDTVIVGSLTVLANVRDFAICESFVLAGGHPNWPCRYGSCVMVLGPKTPTDVFTRFMGNRSSLVQQAGQYGDQKVIEILVPDATLLQHELPTGFFMDRRELLLHKKVKPQATSVVAFAGPLRPANCDIPWIQEAWR